jgi:hypothetical protein
VAIFNSIGASAVLLGYPMQKTGASPSIGRNGPKAMARIRKILKPWIKYHYYPPPPPDPTQFFVSITTLLIVLKTNITQEDIFFSPYIP